MDVPLYYNVTRFVRDINPITSDSTDDVEVLYYYITELPQLASDIVHQIIFVTLCNRVICTISRSVKKGIGNKDISGLCQQHSIIILQHSIIAWQQYYYYYYIATFYYYYIATFYYYYIATFYWNGHLVWTPALGLYLWGRDNVSRDVHVTSRRSSYVITLDCYWTSSYVIT